MNLQATAVRSHFGSRPFRLNVHGFHRAFQPTLGDPPALGAWAPPWARLLPAVTDVGAAHAQPHEKPQAVDLHLDVLAIARPDLSVEQRERRLQSLTASLPLPTIIDVCS